MSDNKVTSKDAERSAVIIGNATICPLVKKGQKSAPKSALMISIRVNWDQVVEQGLTIENVLYVVAAECSRLITDAGRKEGVR